MKKFKQIFYPIYILFALGFVYIAIDSLLNMEENLNWFDVNFIQRRQPYWVMFFILVLGILMLIELIAENIHIKNIKSGIGDLEDEIVRLKAKLFDQMEGEEDDEPEEDEEDQVEEDDDEDEADNKD